MKRTKTFRPEDPDAELMFDQTELDARMQDAVMSLVRAAREMATADTPQPKSQKDLKE